MSEYRYHADELSISLPPSFVDKSSHVLEWRAGEGGLAMMIRRAPLERGKLAEVADKYFGQLEATLAAFRREPTVDVECDVPYEQICFRFRDGAHVLYQVHFLLDLGDKMMFLVWGADAQQRNLVDEVVASSMPTLLLRQE